MPEKELCVICSRETEYTRDTRVDLREHYVEGASQLCKACYDRVYGTSARGNGGGVPVREERG